MLTIRLIPIAAASAAALLALTSETTAQGISPLACPATYLQAPSRSLMWTSDSLTGSATMPRRPHSVEQFYYIVPATQFQSGAIVVKVSHFAQADADAPEEAKDKIALTRPAYATPCRGVVSETVISRREQAGFYRQYSQTIDKQGYVNYHFYKDSNQRLDAFHADVGERKTRGTFSWVFAQFGKRPCVRTNDNPIRGQFLFDDLRRIASFGDLGRRTLSAIVPEVDRAKAASYATYRNYGLAVAVLPYRKASGAKTCIGFRITMPIEHATITRTDIMVIDSDDALFASGATTPTMPDETNQPSDPQHAWVLHWSR